MAKAKAKSRTRIQLDFEEAVQFCKAHLRAGRTPYLEGQPGVGKTTVGRVIAQDESMGFDGSIVVTPTMHNALDLRGFGYVADILGQDGRLIGKETRFAQSRVLPSEGKWLVIVDELPDCPIHEQSGFYQLLLEGRIGEYCLPEGSAVMGCGNSPEHRAAANDLSTAIRGRVSTAILRPDLNCLKRHALKTNWHPLVVSFIQHFPKCLEGFDPDDFAGGCTPRDLDAISRIENAGWPTDDNVSHATCVGNLGNEYGDKYDSHRKIRLPDPDLVLKNPNTAPIPDEPDVMFAYSAAVAQRATVKNIVKIREYSQRLEAASEVGLMYDCMTARPEIAVTETWQDFFEQHECNI